MAHKCMSLCMMSDDIHSVIFLSSHLDLLCTCTCVQLPTGKRFFIFVNSKPQTYLKNVKLFQRCLMSVLHIDLWKCYITYVRQTKVSLQTFRCVCVWSHDHLRSKVITMVMIDVSLLLLTCTCYREKMRQTYEFALDHIGIDFHSGSVWLEFITFLKEE